MFKAITILSMALMGVITRCNPTGTTCNQYIPAMQTHQPPGGWDLGKMSHIMYRESRCQPWARSSTSDSGLLQINDINLPYLSRVMGTTITPSALMNPTTNIRAAAILCTYWRNAGHSCYQPWGI